MYNQSKKFERAIIMIIRAADPEKDSKQISEIEGYYIENTEITYLEVKRTEKEIKYEIEKVEEILPWLVAEEEGKILGYAYASKYRLRPAYRWDCEFSVYLAKDALGCGLGRKFYGVLLEIVKGLGYINVFGVLNMPNQRSEALHEGFGFEKIGYEKGTAYKNGKWLDIAVFQKRLTNSWDKPREPETNWRNLLEQL